MDNPEKDTKNIKKITVNKPSTGKNSQIIINPPEKQSDGRPIAERFKNALAKRSVVLEKKVEIVLNSKASRSDFSEDVIKQVYIKGYKALPLNCNLTREQYAMNRVNSFIAFGEAFIEDCDLIERVGLKGSGGGMRPHIKREVNPYNNKKMFHVVDAKGIKKFSTTDEFAAKRHLASKYRAYLGEAKQMKGEDPCWKGYHMVGKKIKAGREVPNCVPTKEETEVIEASSAAVRMQRSLEKIRADRERKERLAAPYVNSVFAKKVEDKKKDIKEGLVDDILAAAKSRGINAKVAPPLEDRKKATMKLLKHRAREQKRNPPPPRQMPPPKTGFGSGAIDDTKGT